MEPEERKTADIFEDDSLFELEEENRLDQFGLGDLLGCEIDIDLDE
jgi:hypothetical protein